MGFQRAPLTGGTKLGAVGLIWEIEVLRMVAALVVWEGLLVIASGWASRSVSRSA